MADSGKETFVASTAAEPPALSALFSRALDAVLSRLTPGSVQPPASPAQPSELALETPTADAPQVWVDGAENGGNGRIMLSWNQLTNGSELTTHLPGVFAAPGQGMGSTVTLTGHAANDNTLWVGDEDFDGTGGAIGRDPTVAVLPDGHTVVAWISDDNIVHASVYPPGASKHTKQAVESGHSVLTAERLVLGEASAARPNSRLSIATNDGNGFLVLWATEFGFTAALIGKAWLGASESVAASAEPATGTVWHSTPLPPIQADTHSVENLTVTLKDGGLQIAYLAETEDGEDLVPHTVEINVAEHHAHAGSSAPAGHASAAAHPAGSSHSVVHLSHEASSDDPDAPSVPKTADNASQEAPTDAPSDGVVTAPPIETVVSQPVAVDVPVVTPHAHAAGAAPTTHKTVVNAATGTAHTLVIEQGDGPTTTLLVTSTDADGQPVVSDSGEPVTVVVTHNALVSDPDNPELDLAPDITVVDNDVAVVFLERAPGGQAVSLSVAVVSPEDPDAVPVTETISTGDTPQSTISDFSLTTTTHETGQVDLAVLWVANADDDGYGVITAQLAAIIETPAQGSGEPSPSEPAGSEPSGSDEQPAEIATEPQVQIVLLGQDCDSDGDNSAFTLGSGRDPEATTVSGDALAIAWIAPSEADHGEAAIKGAIIGLDNGQILQQIDLSDLMPSGCSDASEIEITSDADGDVILGWLQDAIGGGFDAMVALLARSAAANWLTPSQARQLHHFDDKPVDFSLVVVGGPTLDLRLSWVTDDGVSTAQIITLPSDEASHDVAIAASSGSASSEGTGSGSPTDIVTIALDSDHSSDNSGSSDNHGSGGDSNSSHGSGCSSGSSHDGDSNTSLLASNSGSDHDNSGSGSSHGNDDAGTSAIDSSAASATFDVGVTAQPTFVVVLDLAKDTIYLAAPVDTAASVPTPDAQPVTITSSALDEATITAALDAPAQAADPVSQSGKQGESSHSGKDGSDSDKVETSGHNDDHDHGDDDDRDDDGRHDNSHDSQDDEHSGDHGGHHDGDSDSFHFVSGFGDDAPVADLVLDVHGNLLIDESGFSPSFAFDMPLVEDVFVFDHSGPSILEHSYSGLGDFALI